MQNKCMDIGEHKNLINLLYAWRECQSVMQSIQKERWTYPGNKPQSRSAGRGVETVDPDSWWSLAETGGLPSLTAELIFSLRKLH